MKLKVGKDEVLNLVISGIPSIQKLRRKISISL